MKTLIVLALIISLLGCAGPTLVIKGDEIQAQGFQTVSLNGEKKVFTYKAWYQIGFLDTVINALAGLVGGQISSPKKVEADKVNNTAKVEKLGFPYDLKW